MIRTQILKHSQEQDRPREKRDVRGGAIAKGAIDKSWNVRVIEGEGVRGYDPIEYFFLTVVESTFWVTYRVMAIEIPKNKEISG